MVFVRPAQHFLNRLSMGIMIPNITRGSSPARLLSYLFGKGRRNEHMDQHLIASSKGGGGILGRLFDEQGKPRKPFSQIGEEFDRTYRVLERKGKPCAPDMRGSKNPQHEHGKQRVWHCSLAIKAGQGIISDTQWRELARDYLKRMGLIDESGNDLVPWLAIRHGLSQNGNDHIHIMVNLAGYGDWINPYHDRIAAQKSCRMMEKERPELRELTDDLTRGKSAFQYSQWRKWAQWKAAHDYGPGYAQLDTSERTKLLNQVAYDTMPRQHMSRLVEACAADSRSEDEFIRRVRRCGLNIDPRLKKGVHKGEFDSPDQVVGYTVTWRGSDGWRERISGYALGREYTLKRLRSSWRDDRRDQELAVREWRAAMENRMPAFRDGREKHELSTMDMNRLIDESFKIAIGLRDSSDCREYESALRDGLLTFDRLRFDYGLERTPAPQWAVQTEMPDDDGLETSVVMPGDMGFTL
jgi:hypothetical protein